MTTQVSSNGKLKSPTILLRMLLLLFSCFILVSCGGGSDNGDDEGITGTGIMLEGTTSSPRAYASNSIEIKAKSGEISAAEIQSNGRFREDTIPGEGPYLLRANMGNNEYLYGIGHTASDGTVKQNVHGYTDAAIRNWFEKENLDIDPVFNNGDAIPRLPDVQEIGAINNTIQSVVSSALGAYSLDGIDLSSVDYAADNTGVDLYLNKNPVLIKNAAITIIVTDPDTQTLTQASSDLPLSTDLSGPDTIAPGAPAGVKALASASNEIVVVWETAADNIGINGYQVFRDGMQIATTAFPVYLDTGLAGNTLYRYHIIALDGNANRSPTSITAESQTLQAPDVIAPPAPVDLTLVPALQSVKLNWSQSSINDVASFNVLRSLKGNQTQLFANVTATFMTDATAMSGTEYCYQIVALDASENESPPTDILCTTTDGVSVENPGSGNAGQGGDQTSGPPMIDVSNYSCTETLAENINSDQVIEAGCYLANNGLSVNDPANLTLEAGVVIKFNAGKGLIVKTGASLTAEGSAGNPVVLTGIQPTAGYWNGVQFVFSNSVRNRLDYVQIEYAGGGSTEANVSLASNGPSVSRVSMNNSTLRNGMGYGFSFDQNSIVESFESNAITANNAPALVAPDVVSALNSSSRYTGNAIDSIYLTNNRINKATTFRDLGVDFNAKDLYVDSVLTIEAGSTLTFRNTGFMKVGLSGALKILGDADRPVTLTAAEPIPGFWDGISFIITNNASNVLRHAIVEYAGGSSDKASLFVIGGGSSTLSVDSVTLRYGLEDGFIIRAPVSLLQFDNITSTQNGRTGAIADTLVGVIGSNASFTGNSVDQLFVLSSQVINSDIKWPTLDVPYVVGSLFLNAKLTLSPGTNLLMRDGATIRVNGAGAFSAIGTAQQPISISGLEQVPGYWNSILLQASDSVENAIEHSVIEYGGGGSLQTGNIEMVCNSSFISRLSVSNTQLRNSASWGLFADPSGCLITMGDDVSYSGNAAGQFNLQQ